MRARVALCLLSSLLTAAAFAGPTTAPSAVPGHLKLADKMVAEIKPDHNQYKSGPYTVTWKGLAGAKVTENASDCTTYVTALLKMAYAHTAGDFEAWTGASSPSIGRYYDAAVAKKGFRGFKAIADLKPGDLLISKYAKAEKGSAAGHMMIVDAPPTRTKKVGDLQAYDITVVDCTSSPHADDTRSKKANGGEQTTGIGRGTMQVYADAAGDVAEWSWSAGNRMIRYTADTRPLIFAKVPADGRKIGK